MRYLTLIMNRIGHVTINNGTIDGYFQLENDTDYIMDLLTYDEGVSLVAGDTVGISGSEPRYDSFEIMIETQQGEK